MAKRRILIIGGVAAGTKAAAKCRRESPEADITIITDERYISYAGCGLPYFIGSRMERGQLEVMQVAQFAARNDVEILTEHRALSINAEHKTVLAKDLREGSEKEFAYDVLILATGSSPFSPPLGGIDIKNIFTLRTIGDGEAIKSLVDSGRVKNAVIVGGGYIGLEVAENLVERGVRVSIVEALEHICPRFDEEIAIMVQNHLKEKGVTVYTGQKVVRFHGNDAGEVSHAELENGDMIEADMILWSVGVRPNTELAKTAGIELGESGAIKVDNRMQTSVPDIYAAGDCAETTHVVTGRQVWIPLGSTANKMGRVAAINACGGRETFPGVLGSSVVKVFEMNLATTGLTAKAARAEGYDVETVLVPETDRAGYIPGFEVIVTKLVADRKTRRVLGGQVVGRGVVDKPIDILVAAITMKATVDDLANMDFAYAPPFSPAMSSTITAANTMRNKLAGKLNVISPLEMKKMLDERGEVELIDVRNEEMYAEKHIPGSRLIPWGEIRKKTGDLPKDKPIVTICNRGKSAYCVQLILDHAGFEDVKTFEGGLAAYPFETESGK
ncbi:MAG: dehydrogenase [Planctomycetota bacterium]|nr:MAG: dehydrogenase [Planctomycetota bacterium]